jgi:cell division protein ZipA
MKLSVILAIVVVFGLMGYAYLRLIVAPKKELLANSSKDYYISTTTESDQKLKDMGMYVPSEDVSYILDTNKLSYPKLKRTESEYKPDTATTWVIDLRGTFNKKDLNELFDEEWTLNFPSDIYGHATKWTYIFAADSPEKYDEIKVAVNLRDIFNMESADYKVTLDKYLTELNSRIAKYAGKVTLTKKESIAQAMVKGQKIASLNQQFDQAAIIILKSDSIFDGLKAWDVLRSIGLQWGDGDEFHWNNHYAYGSDLFFSVWTTTEPGYFLPERVKAGQMNPGDLVFGFSIPRSADPEHVFNVMTEAVKYAQKRLGGTIIDKNHQPFNEEQERKTLITLVNNMKAKGVIAGSEDALMLFSR